MVQYFDHRPFAPKAQWMPKKKGRTKRPVCNWIPLDPTWYHRQGGRVATLGGKMIDPFVVKHALLRGSPSFSQEVARRPPPMGKSPLDSDLPHRPAAFGRHNPVRPRLAVVQCLFIAAVHGLVLHPRQHHGPDAEPRIRSAGGSGQKKEGKEGELSRLWRLCGPRLPPPTKKINMGGACLLFVFAPPRGCVLIRSALV